MFNISKKDIPRIANTVGSYAKIVMLITSLWFVFSGTTDPFLVGCGVFSIVITLTVCVYCNIFSTKIYIIRIGFIRYVYVLLKDVILSTIQMVKIIFSKKIDINPGTMTINTSKLDNQEKVLFANLITMTPGTFVIAVEGDNFLIHALNRDDLDFKDNQEIINLLNKIRKNDN